MQDRQVRPNATLIARGVGNFDYYLEPSGHVVSVARPGRGCVTTTFGDMDYFRFILSTPSFAQTLEWVANAD